MPQNKTMADPATRKRTALEGNEKEAVTVEEVAAAKKKKAKPIPPLEDPKYASMLLCLKQLHSCWYNSSLKEQKGLLRRMTELISLDESECGLPHTFPPPWESDGQKFDFLFQGLTRAEQTGFYETASLCHSQQRSMENRDLNDMLRSIRPSEPYYVAWKEDTYKYDADGSLEKIPGDAVPVDKYADGTARFPFLSKAQLMEKTEGDSVQVRMPGKCSPPSCRFVKCLNPGCQQFGCGTHGTRIGSFSRYEEDIEWEEQIETCCDCHRWLFACSEHEDEMKTCFFCATSNHDPAFSCDSIYLCPTCHKKSGGTCQSCTNYHNSLD